MKSGFRFQIGVIGSSNRDAGGMKRAERIGRKIVQMNCRLLTGGCTGLPYAAVRGAKNEGGLTLGVSPASDRREHVEEYGYPVEDHDLMIYTGFGYKGRNVALVRSSDAVIATGGRMGTLNELTIAYDAQKVIGLLEGSSGAADEFSRLAEKFGRPGRGVVSNKEPEKLVEEVVRRLKG